ncbi:MAG: C45 family autoproteolytic acyltransferase/hydrolase [Verrucomicrobiae bacterium]|nr:C45 family autoproteolytic acyltransferase/hydrolase [Verrucomicrobiae bacterium]
MKSRRRIARLLIGLLALAALDWAAATFLIWTAYGNTAALLTDPTRLSGQHVRLTVTQAGEKPRVPLRLELFAPANAGGFRLAVDYDGHPVELISMPDETRVVAFQSKACFAAAVSNMAEARRALAELGDAMRRGLIWQRIGLSILPHPVLVKPWPMRIHGPLCWRVALAGGHADIALHDSLPREVQVQGWRATFHRAPLDDHAQLLVAAATARDKEAHHIENTELDRSLAAVLRGMALQFKEVPREPDARRSEGNGSLEIRDGWRVLRLRGKPYDIGFQHGRLLAPNIKRLCDRVVYGVGFYYSIEKGRWFLTDAAQLVERQRPFIAPEYFEELRGLADGAGLPLALVQAANIFPEFFHCSGAAVFGKATKGGTLLHARVLDYMTEVGLQDEAVLMAVERVGARRFVNVSYAGFIGSVTGMNEKQVAIGEMGGRGEGKWDGTPMSFLLRGALENCDTLEQALDYMRTKPRTCEYYYVVSDGKSRTARGVAATPEKFEVVAPGQAVPLLPDPVEDAVLLSAGDRYKHLVRLVRGSYGRIGPEEFKKIIARPVAMRSNLHNAIFEPPTLTTWIAHASRHAPACDQPYRRYTWAELFGEAK